jgi:TP901 family phage tail tape measure protein
VADQNQTVNTVFTAETNLESARQQLEAFTKLWESRLGAVAKATDAIGEKTLKTIEKFNKFTGAADKFQRTLEKQGYSQREGAIAGGNSRRRDIKGEGATIEGELFTYRKKVSKALAGTVLEIDAELRKIDERLSKIGNQRRKFAAEISELNATRDNLARTRAAVAVNPFVAQELSGARSAKSQQALKNAAQDERALQRAVEDLTRSQVRLLQINTELDGLSARAGGKTPGRIKALRDERDQLESLIRAYQAVGEVTRRAQGNEGKLLGGALSKERRDIVTQARQVIDSENRVLEIKQRILLHDEHTNKLSDQQLKQLQLELAMLEKVLALGQADVAVQERVAALRERASKTRGGAADKPVNLDVAAGRVLDIEKMTIKAQAEIVRLKAAGNAEDARKAQMLQSELSRLAEEAKKLNEIAGIEARITLERAKQAKETKAPKNPADQTHRTLERLRADGGVGIIGIQSELMANYAVLSAAQQAAYALGSFVVQYEKALAQFQAIAAASGSETARLSLTIQELGQNTHFTNLEIAATATLLAQAGLSTTDTERALKAIAELATAAGTELRQAADVVTSIASVWNVATEDFGRVADVLTSALNRTKLGMDQIQLGIQYAANTAQDAGIGFIELTAALGAMADAGIRSGSTLGTGLRALIVDLEGPTAKARATFDRLGLTLADVDIRSLGLTQVLVNLKQAGFSSADAFGAFEIRAASAFTALSNNTGKLIEHQKNLTETGAAAEANAVQMDTVAAKWTQFTNVMKSAGDGALAPLVVIFKGFLDVATLAISVIGSLGPVGQGAATGIAVMIAAMAVGKVIAAAQALGLMVSSIRLMPPALAAATVATQVLTTNQAVAATASMRLSASLITATGTTGGFATALTFLGRVPMVLIVGAVVSLVAGIAAASGAFKKAEDRADTLKGEINDLTSQIDESKKAIRGIDDTIIRLSSSMVVLAENPVMRGRVLDEARTKFESMGLEIKTGSDSVEDMITALEKLRTELQKQFSSELLSLADRLEERIFAMNLELGKGEFTSAENVKAIAKGYDYNQNKGFVGEKTKLEKLGPSAVFAYQAVQKERKVFDADGSLADDVTPDQLRKVQIDLGNIRREMQQALNNEKNPGRRREMEADITLMNTLINAYSDMLAKVRAVRTEEEQLAETRENSQYQLDIGGDTRPGKLFSEMDRKYATFDNEMARLKDTKLSADEMVKKADEITVRAREAGVDIYLKALAESKYLIPKFRDRYLNEVSDRGSQRVGKLGAQVDPLRRDGTREASASGAAGQRGLDDNQAVDAKLASARAANIDAQLDQLEAQIPLAKNGAELAALTSRYQSLLEQYEPLLVAQSEAALQAKGFYDRLGTVDILAPMVERQESNNNDPRYQTSSAGALGAMQLMPGTARAAAKRLGKTDIAGLSDELLKQKLLKDPELNRLLGREELRYLLAKYDGNTVLALAAYNAGPGRLDGYMKDGKFNPGWLKTIGDPRAPGGPSSAEFAAKIPIKETREYVAKIAGRAAGVTGSDDPRIAETRRLEGDQAATEVATRRTKFLKAARDRQMVVEYAVLSRQLKEERDTNNAQIEFLLKNMSGVEGNVGQLATSVAQVDSLNRRNFDITEQAFWADPKNVDRKNAPSAIYELEELLTQAIIKAAENNSEAMDAYVASRDLGASRNVGAAQTELDRAQQNGAGATTVWSLQQRVDWEEYQAALTHQTAVEEALALAQAARADATATLAEAILIAQPALFENAAIAIALADPKITEAQRTQLLIRKAELEVMVAQADAAVKLAKARADIAGNVVGTQQGNVLTAAAGVSAATPGRPIYEGNKTATTASNGTQTPEEMVKAAAARFGEQSGVFQSTSDTIADGIYQTFEALGAGINKTIDQIADGSVTIKGAFQNILGGMLQELQQTAAKIATNMIMKYLLTTIMNMGMSGATTTPMGGTGSGPGTTITAGSGTTVSGMRMGGEIKARRMAGGGAISNRDSQLILGEPGEVVMRKSAVDFVGKKNLLAINALGNRSISQAGAAVAPQAPREPDKVNVWVVSPQQVPVPGPRDIVHYVAADLAQGGTLKKLVRQVAMGG